MADWIYNHYLNLITGMFFSLIGYFAEIEGAIHVMWAALLFDLITGILASVWKRRERFCMSKFFVSISRAIGATLLVALLYAMDREMHQEIAASYNIAAWLISGFYAWSASENMDTVFGGRIFGILKLYFAKRVEETSGIEITKSEEHGKL